MKQKAEELKKTYEGLDEGVKQHMGKLHELIEKNAMTPEQVELMIDNAMKVPDNAYPELAEVEGITGAEYAELYKKMAEEIKANPAKYESHIKASGMSAEELAALFDQINGAVVRYPEVWESKEAAQMLSPKNLAILVNVFKK